MEYVRTLSNIFVSDTEKVGERAVDLATLSRKNFNIPLTIVLTSHALEEFVKVNDLNKKGGDLLAKRDFKGLQKEVLAGKMPDGILNELKEAYETLSVGEKSGADEIVSSGQLPFVTVIVSPHYTTNDNSVIQNVRGLGALESAIKQAWSTLFSEKSFSQRKDLGVKEFFAGIIIQRTHTPGVSALGVVKDNSVNISTWFGFPDFDNELEKDKFEIHKEFLRIDSHSVNHQIYKLTRNEEDQLEKFPLEGKGSEQKVDDKTVVELGRLTKKMSIEVNADVRAFYFLEKGNVYLMFMDKLSTYTEPEVQSTPVEISEEPVVEEVKKEADEEPIEEVVEEAPAEEHEETPEEEFVEELQEIEEPEIEGLEEAIQPDEPAEEITSDEEPVEDYTKDHIEVQHETEGEIQEIEETPEESFEDTESGEIVDEPVEQEAAFESAQDLIDEVADEPQTAEETLEAPSEPVEEVFEEIVEEKIADEEPETVIEETTEELEEIEKDSFEDLADNVSHVKEIVHELDDLIQQADETEVRHKLNELHEAMKKLRKE